ncbi:hypothetical protein C8035_v000260 [Colletotrichum spinosum]|uniref:Uncharacterized protein n=1 Tax=Colletotrichum spinosum TaxID=1347390 RepID=A0A4R8PKT2_9PEZI|nr:hypothetical protein C8035_v000260 [Colletotrichum spinosum]
MAKLNLLAVIEFSRQRRRLLYPKNCTWRQKRDRAPFHCHGVRSMPASQCLDKTPRLLGFRRGGGLYRHCGRGNAQ